MQPYGNYKPSTRLCTCLDCGGSPAPEKGYERLKSKREIEKDMLEIEAEKEKIVLDK